MSIPRGAAVLVAAMSAFAMPVTASAATAGPELVSVDGAGNPMTDRAAVVQVSDDGSKVAFAEALNDAPEEEYRFKVFVRDREAHTTKEYLDISESLDADEFSYALSGNGRFLVVYDFSTGSAKYTKYDLQEGTSKSIHGPDRWFEDLDISDDGSKLIGYSYSGLYAIDGKTGTSTRLAGSDTRQLGDHAQISGDGTRAVYSTYDGAVYTVSTAGGSRKRIDVRPDGTGTNGEWFDRAYDLSDDGRYVLFGEAPGGGIARGCKGTEDDFCLFRRDTVKRTTALVNRNPGGAVWREWRDGGLSDDGSKVAFLANFQGGDVLYLQVRDVSTGKITTLGRNADGELNNREVLLFDLAGNGSDAAVISEATNYGVGGPDDQIRRVWAVN